MKRPVGANPLGPMPPVPVREANAADAPELARLLGAAFPDYEWTIERAHKDLLDAPDVPVTFVVEEGGKLIATASVREHPRWPESGYVHWVGVDPTERGRRLGRVVMWHVMERRRAEGRTSSILETDDFRLPAITSYLGQGFIPQYLDPDHAERWSKIFEVLAAQRFDAKGK